MVEEYSKVTNSEFNETFRQAEHEIDDVIEVVKVDNIVTMGSLEEETNLHFQTTSSPVQTTSSPVNYSDVTEAGVDQFSYEESMKLVDETNLTQGVKTGKEVYICTFC